MPQTKRQTEERIRYDKQLNESRERKERDKEREREI